MIKYQHILCLYKLQTNFVVPFYRYLRKFLENKISFLAILQPDFTEDKGNNP